ncbi:MAG: DNA polymerase III subunit alpha [Pseudonocardiales bacterium]
MADPFVHLHVASGYSLRHGASAPRVLAERAAEHGMDSLALTDRDGVYGAVKFVTACRDVGVRPLFGVDLAIPALVPAPPARAGAATRRTPARGGAQVDPRLPRVMLLAQDGRGWASLCRLISATHLAGERSRPVTSLDLIAAHAAGLFVLLGPASELGRAVAAHRPDLARAALERWRSVIPSADLLVEIVAHRGPGDTGRAAALLGFAAEVDLPAVLTNAVRYADRADAPTADVLDSARRLVPLGPRTVDRVNAEGYLKSGKEMADVAAEVCGPDRDAARRLLARTRHIAEQCAVDPRADLGIGEVHFPELAVSGEQGEAGAVLRARCEAGLGRRTMPFTAEVDERLEHELGIIDALGYPSYFLTVADVGDLIRSMGVRCAARGSGAGSLVTYLLGISDVDPLRYRLLMERFLSPLRKALPDIDIDVESARRTEVYEAVLARFGVQRCACVSMMDTYRARHAIRDVGAALGLPPGEIDAVAKAFPHIRANQLRQAMQDLPELRASGLGEARLALLFTLAERLDGLPRHIALHPCGVLLSDATLLDRTPVEASYLGFPMSQFDKDDVEELGLLKLDLLGIRMQSAMAHAISEVQRVDGERIDIDAVPRDDPATFELVRSTRLLGCFQIESPGQRELIGKFGPETFEDLIVDISLFRPGPVKSDMVTPFLEARQGWAPARYFHDDVRPALEQTCGVVVFHEQVLEIVAVLTGCTLAEADEVRRALGDKDGQEDVRVWFRPVALARGYDLATVERAWEILRAFGSFGFCKAHAAAFALPTYQSAWLKAHHPAAFLAGVLTHDPGMYPKRLILDDARQFGIAVLGLDVNASEVTYRVERVGVYDEPPPEILGQPPRAGPEMAGLTDGRAYGIRLALADVKGISAAEIARIVAGRPYHCLADFWHRAAVSRPIVERLVVAGGFDSLYGIGTSLPVRRRGQVTRRDLLLQAAEFDQWSRGVRRSARAAAPRSRAAAAPVDVQLALDLGDDPAHTSPSGLPEMTGAERVRAELDVLGLDASCHVVDFYEPFFAAVGMTRARDLLHCRSKAEVLVAGVKVATQTPPIRSGRRVVFVTLDDATGPVDATFFEDAQVGYASTLFHSWLLVIRGEVRRTGRRGVSIRATGCWELPALRVAWEHAGLAGVVAAMQAPAVLSEEAVHGAAESRSDRPVTARPPAASGGRAVLVSATGFRLSPYADIKPAGESPKDAPRKLWHSSPGSSGG